ncbi:hypothetical protein CR162_11120 [Pseudoroseomonas rhizosphaerae]|uniref:Cytochrome c domain-containing protein n=1 Tax=Teichococcus rhizosphaerae TaxID=1335062 RepID=A0A2C7AD03_9PROT|nr:c-type cytochrome [Pseudoroseomonas rhizosphaerae]PHK94976.1 hypothetical protein CR162_11120 [Pseudoroseomonas rhizosphaerae]
MTPCPFPLLPAALAGFLAAALAALPAAAQAPPHGGPLHNGPVHDGPVHDGPVRALAMEAEGARLASGGFDQAVMLWPADLSRPLSATRWHGQAVQALAALPGGGFASGGADGRIALWPAGGGATPSRVLHGHASAIAALAVREGQLLSASWDGTARLWPLAGGAARVLEGHQGQVTGAAFRADGLPVTAGADGTLRGWPADGPPLLLAGHGLPQTALIGLPDGTLASAGVDGAIRLTSSDGQERRLQSGPFPIAALAATPDGALLAAAGPGGGVLVWALPEGRLRHSLPSAGLPVWALAFAPDGGRLYTAGADRRLRAFDMRSGAALGAGPAPPAGRVAGPEEPRGARVFRACGACHSLAAPPAGQADMKAGPHLGGLFGRRMGSVPGYAYSERLSRGDIVWTKETVADLFTRGPDVVTPGTRMPVQTIGDDEDMAALLRFLEQATRD